MPFLDDLGKKMTGSMDLSRLQSAVTAEERIRADLQYQIGVRYTELHMNDPEESLADLMNQIKESNARTDEYRRLIRNMKGLVQCTNCGADMARGIQFCTQCGAKMPVIPEEKPSGGYCVFCGQPIPEGSKFCLNCGRPVATSPQQ